VTCFTLILFFIQSETESLPCPIFCLNLGTFPGYVLPMFTIVLVISGPGGSQPSQSQS